MRYARQVVLGNIGEEGQELLSRSSVAVVGVGALGTVAADLLVRAGVGKVILIDKDVIDLSNLQRVALFTDEDVGKMKASAGKEVLAKVNPEVEVVAHDVALDPGSVELLRSDVVIDCTDNDTLGVWCRHT
jgi:adenylyltransferase/sulfurtransferase